MKKLSSFLSVMVLSGMFILATGWERYSAHPLKPISLELLAPFSLEEQKVIVTAKPMSARESQKNFGHDLLSRGVQPLQLTIENNTPHEYSLCPSSVDLPRVKPSQIAFKVSRSAIPRAIAYKVASLLFWPFAIPSTIDGIRTFTHHKQFKQDLKAKGMREEIVAPYATFHRVLFVPKDELQSSFKVTLIDLETLKPSEFHLSLPKMDDEE